MKRSRLHPLATRVRPPYAGEARSCLESRCITVLNGYNPGPYCLRHTVEEAITDAQHSAELEREAKRDARVRELVG